MLAGQKVPSAYRAYARLAVSDPTLPTIVAPLGPLDALDQQSPSRLAAFWGEFYEKLGESSDVEEAMRSARNRSHARAGGAVSAAPERESVQAHIG